MARGCGKAQRGVTRGRFIGSNQGPVKMAIGGNPGDLATGGFGTGISGRAATPRDVSNAVSRGESMARDREIGQGNDRGGAGSKSSMGSPASRAAASAAARSPVSESVRLGDLPAQSMAGAGVDPYMARAASNEIMGRVSKAALDDMGRGNIDTSKFGPRASGGNINIGGFAVDPTIQASSMPSVDDVFTDERIPESLPDVATSGMFDMPGFNLSANFGLPSFFNKMPKQFTQQVPATDADAAHRMNLNFNEVMGLPSKLNAYQAKQQQKPITDRLSSEEGIVDTTPESFADYSGQTWASPDYRPPIDLRGPGYVSPTMGSVVKPEMGNIPFAETAAGKELLAKRAAGNLTAEDAEELQKLFPEGASFFALPPTKEQGIFSLQNIAASKYPTPKGYVSGNYNEYPTTIYSGKTPINTIVSIPKSAVGYGPTGNKIATGEFVPLPNSRPVAEQTLPEVSPSLSTASGFRREPVNVATASSAPQSTFRREPVSVATAAPAQQPYPGNQQFTMNTVPVPKNFSGRMEGLNFPAPAEQVPDIVAPVAKYTPVAKNFSNRMEGLNFAAPAQQVDNSIQQVQPTITSAPEKKTPITTIPPGAISYKGNWSGSPPYIFPNRNIERGGGRDRTSKDGRSTEKVNPFEPGTRKYLRWEERYGAAQNGDVSSSSDIADTGTMASTAKNGGFVRGYGKAVRGRKGVRFI